MLKKVFINAIKRIKDNKEFYTILSIQYLIEDIFKKK